MDLADGNCNAQYVFDCTMAIEYLPVSIPERGVERSERLPP